MTVCTCCVPVGEVMSGRAGEDLQDAGGGGRGAAAGDLGTSAVSITENFFDSGSSVVVLRLIPIIAQRVRPGTRDRRHQPIQRGLIDRLHPTGVVDHPRRRHPRLGVAFAMGKAKMGNHRPPRFRWRVARRYTPASEPASDSESSATRKLVCLHHFATGQRTNRTHGQHGTANQTHQSANHVVCS